MKTIEAWTYDDIQLRPQYSEVQSRSDVKLKTKLTKRFGLLTPLVASPMDTVCDSLMAQKLMKYGGVGCIHRFMSIQDQVEHVQKVKEYKNQESLDEKWGVMYDDWHTEVKQIPIMAAIGVGHNELSRAQSLLNAGANVLLIDVAHGHHKNVKDMLVPLTNMKRNHEFDIIAGNVATYEGAMDLCKWGVDGVRVGVGGGCFTPDMEVRTNNGLKKIKNIEIGDEVYTHTGELKPVIDKFEYNDYDEVYDIDGIEATGNHKFYVVHESKVDLVNDENIHDYAEWIKAEDLTNEYLLIEL